METIQVTLHLSTIDGLFEAPETNPLKYPGPYESGIDTILEELNQAGRVESVQILLLLPSEQIQPDMESRVKAALERYCNFQIRKNQSEIQLARRIARRQLVSALPFMGIALVLSVLFAAVVGNTTNTWLQVFAGIFATLFSVASWIIVWDPIESMLYGWRPMLTENMHYLALSQAMVEITGEP
ncbi:MAG: hypothetical protein H6Q37_2488 [Chloroflexi bacterium]|nr:hypothetical protein [Chloroflexota bacterium]